MKDGEIGRNSWRKQKSKKRVRNATKIYLELSISAMTTL
jgi:hypothetical protein